MSSNLKKLSIILWGIAFIVMIFFLVLFMQKRQMREYYNLGNESYNDGYYDVAESYYKLALEQNPTHDEQCPIRINEALSIVTPLTPDSITEDNLDETIARLEEARDILCEDGCADMDDENGHNEQSQILKDEIDAYIESLKNPPESDSGDQDQDQSQDQDSEQDQNQDQNQSSNSDSSQQQSEEEKQEEELRQEFENIQQQGMEERQSDLDYGEESGNYEYYGGKSW